MICEVPECSHQERFIIFVNGLRILDFRVNDRKITPVFRWKSYDSIEIQVYQCERFNRSIHEMLSNDLPDDGYHVPTVEETIVSEVLNS